MLYTQLVQSSSVLRNALGMKSAQRTYNYLQTYENNLNMYLNIFDSSLQPIKKT